jgi:hypothetical protein
METTTQSDTLNWTIQSQPDHTVSFDISAFTAEQIAAAQENLRPYGLPHFAQDGQTLFIENVSSLEQADKMQKAVENVRLPRVSRMLLRHHQPERSIEFEVLGNPSQAFVDEIRQSFQNLPQSAQALLGAMGVKVKIGKIRTDCLPDEIAEYKTPTENDARTHSNQTSGCYASVEAAIVLSEYALKNDASLNPVVETRLAHQTGILNGNWYKSPMPADTVRHEVGHAFSYTIFYPNDPCASVGRAMESFQCAYDADCAMIGGPEEGIKRGLQYFMQANSKGTGSEEVFAELWAEVAGENTKYNLIKNFPHCAKWMQSFQKGFNLASAQGPAEIARFVYEFDAGYRLPLAKPLFTAEQRQALTINRDAQHDSEQVMIPIAQRAPPTGRFLDDYVASQRQMLDCSRLESRVRNAIGSYQTTLFEKDGVFYITMPEKTWNRLPENLPVLAELAQQQKERSASLPAYPSDMPAANIQTDMLYKMTVNISEIPQNDRGRLFDTLESLMNDRAVASPRYDFAMLYSDPNMLSFDGIKTPDAVKAVVEDFAQSLKQGILIEAEKPPFNQAALENARHVASQSADEPARMWIPVGSRDEAISIQAKLKAAGIKNGRGRFTGSPDYHILLSVDDWKSVKAFEEKAAAGTTPVFLLQERRTSKAGVLPETNTQTVNVTVAADRVQTIRQSLKALGVTVSTSDLTGQDKAHTFYIPAYVWNTLETQAQRLDAVPQQMHANVQHDRPPSARSGFRLGSQGCLGVDIVLEPPLPQGFLHSRLGINSQLGSAHSSLPAPTRPSQGASPSVDHYTNS